MVFVPVKPQTESIAPTERRQAIDWLRNNGFPALPVAPAQDAYKHHKIGKAQPDKGVWEHCPVTEEFKPIPLYTGKNPSYVDRGGKPHLVNHRQYQHRLPSKQELRDWFANPTNGVGTLGGWNDTQWLDFDTKQFSSQEECDRAVQSILERPELQNTFVERTHSGGWRIGVRSKSTPGFTNFALTPGGDHVGEALGVGRFTVLAPTVGVSGNPYTSINRTVPVDVESLETIGIYSTKTDKQNQRVECSTPMPTSTLVPGSIPLEMLGNNTSCAILRGNPFTGDRSEVLTAAIQEWYGWQNWAGTNGVTVSGDVETLAQYAGGQLGLDADRIQRIIKSIDFAQCQPAALYKGGEESCWKKVSRLDNATYDAKCPAHIKDAIASEWKAKRDNGNSGGGSGDGGGNGDSNNGFGDGNHQANEWNAPVSWNGEIGWLVSEERAKSETDADTGEVKSVVDDKGKPIKERVSKFVPKCNFDFQVERELSSEDGGGLVLQVRRSIDNEALQKRVIIASVDYGTAKDFEQALKKSLGSGIVVNLKSEQLKSLIHTRVKEYRDRGGRIYCLAERVGQQSDGTWVFKNIQFTREGNITNEAESGWVFNPNLGGEDKMPVPQIANPDSKALKRLVDAMRKFHGSGILPAMITLGYVAAGVHYQEIMRQEGHFPLINLFGDAGSNKSVAAQNGLSLVGWATKGMLHRVTVSGLYEWLKNSGGMTCCLDDPERSPNLDEILKGLYNGTARKVRGNYQEPHSPPMVTSNHTCGDYNPATLSRLILIFFQKQIDGDTNAWYEMQEAQRLASGGLPDIIKLGYPTPAVKKLADELRNHLPKAHARVADSLGLVTWYAMAVARLAEFPAEKIKEYVINQLCKVANDTDSKADSLTDFIDKLQALHTESLIGDWSIKVVDTEDIGKAIAVNMSSVWNILDDRFTPTYSRRVLESLIDKAGGRIQSVQKFHHSKDESLAYRRGLLNPRTDVDGYPVPPREPEMISRRCVLIPASVAQSFIESWRHHNPPSPDDDGSGGNGNGGGNNPQPCASVTPVTSSYSQLHEKCNQQNVDSESVSALLVSSVTYFEKEEEDLKEAACGFIPLTQDSTITSDDRAEQLSHTLIPEKNVTKANSEPETQQERKLQRLHSGCNSDVTDVTECNQAAFKDVIAPDTLLPPPTFRVGDKVFTPSGVGEVEYLFNETGRAGVQLMNGRFTDFEPAQLVLIREGLEVEVRIGNGFSRCVGTIRSFSIDGTLAYIQYREDRKKPLKDARLKIADIKPVDAS